MFASISMCYYIRAINERVWRFFFLPKKWSRPLLFLSVNQFRVKNYYILLLDKYRYLEMNISANRRLISKSFKRFTEKNRTWFFHSDRSFSVLLLQDPFRKHDSFGKSPVAWRNLAATHIFPLLRVICKMQRVFFRIAYLPKKEGKKNQRGKDRSETHLNWGSILANSNSAKPVVQERCDSSYLSVN